MSSKNAIGFEASDVSNRAQRVDEDGFGVVDEVAEREANLRPTVEMEIQAKVDTNHPDVGYEGLTLAAEERARAREWEIERTSRRFDQRPDSDREVRTRRAAGRGSRERRAAFERRAASVDPSAAPTVADPREELSRDELGAVNRAAARMSERLQRWSRAAIARAVAERVLEGASVTSAVVGTYERLREQGGQVIPIGAVEDANRGVVSIAGRVTQLWDSSSPKIAKVGLLEEAGDGEGPSERIKFTVWKASEQPRVREGERVVVREAATSWYEGRCSVALTSRSQVEFPERERWWVE